MLSDNICDLRLSSVIVNNLKDAGITKISDLLKLDEKSLCQLAEEKHSKALLSSAKMAVKIYYNQKKHDRYIRKVDKYLENRRLSQAESNQLSILKLSCHTEKALYHAGIFYIDKLKKMAEKDLKKIHTLGQKEIKMIFQKLRNLEEAQAIKKIIAYKKSLKQKSLRVNNIKNIVSHDPEYVCENCFMFDGVQCTMYKNAIDNCTRLKDAKIL